MLKVTDSTPGGTPAASRSDAVAALITVPALAEGAARAAQLRATLTEAAEGRLREYTLVADGLAGVVLLWRDQATAAGSLSDAWRACARQQLGAESVVEWYDAPVLLPSALTSNGTAAQ